MFNVNKEMISILQLVGLDFGTNKKGIFQVKMRTVRALLLI